MLGLTRRESASADLGAIDQTLATLAAKLADSSDPFDRLRILESIDTQLDRRLTAMFQRDDAG